MAADTAMAADAALAADAAMAADASGSSSGNNGICNVENNSTGFSLSIFRGDLHFRLCTPLRVVQIRKRRDGFLFLAESTKNETPFFINLIKTLNALLLKPKKISLERRGVHFFLKFLRRRVFRSFSSF